MRNRSWPTIQRHAELLARWQTLCHDLGVGARIAHTQGVRLINTWDRLPRYYHDTTHLLACLKGLDGVQSQLQNPHSAALALWFHDAVYWPRRHDNEDRSAQWAAEFMAVTNLSPVVREQVTKHILETRHHALPMAGDAQYVIDIDLGVLGQSEAAYATFERNVRKEYRHVPQADYATGRSAVLQSFLDRPRIYATDWFFDRLETAARRNLSAAFHHFSHPLEITDTTGF